MTSNSNHKAKGRVSRRTVLQASAGLGVVGLAGCLGDGGETVTVGASSDGSASYGAMNALQRSVSNHAEDAQLNITAPGGDPDSIRAYDAGELDGYTAGNFVFNQALDDGEPFDEEPVDDFAYQALSYLSLHMHWLAVDGSGVESIEEAIDDDDLNIWVGPPGWGLRTLCTSILDDAGLWDDIEDPVDVASEDVAAQIDEDRIDVFFGYGTNFNSLPGWLVEADSREDLYALEMGDDYVEAIESSEAGYAEVEPYGYDQDIDADEIQCWTEDYNTYFASDVDDEVVYEIMEISHEHWEEIQEADDNYMDQSDPADMAQYYHENIPVHPGAADFLEDNDAWDDDWERGD
ncbi:TAXI family TRAP transporter solute-binding subunit [Natronorubrum daqingense]|uniref:TRAP transporter solute receptor, TAXI family n=1 Tax=Natronorubrum daqingense TaxID=588898 RepID=A0A1N7ESN6_9EURY|nr:TAXI family TRAP transporter solute-binding subunit [Natronorubrum daqingense]APX97738.1 hypothetical protein BB347_14550 [Natronorubrum daqingense]SIR91123.1 hypothetical protein SAMN05421809_2842 [Natronorubrum daqingense]